MPGHFLVRHKNIEDLYIDPFYGGILLSEDECAQRLGQVTGSAVSWDSRHLQPVSSRELIARVIRNLKLIYMGDQHLARALTMIDWLLVLRPQQLEEYRDRGLVHYRLGNYAEALDDLRRYADATTVAPDLPSVLELIGRIRTLIDD